MRQQARRRLMSGKCWALDQKTFAYLAHRGATFGTVVKMTVVGLSQKMGEYPDMWSVMPTTEVQGDGTL